MKICEIKREIIYDYTKEQWKELAKTQLSEDFIRQCQNKLDWSIICEYQNLSEKFIEEFQTKVDWDYISANKA